MNLTVLMAAYNARDYIGPALLSVLSQSGMQTLDLVVVDDGSTDDTAEIVQGMSVDYPQIRLIRTERQGVTRARNVGLDALDPATDLVSFLDADDILPVGRYARDIALFHDNPTLDLVFGVTAMFNKPNADQTAPAEDSKIASGRGIQLAAGTYRREMLQKVGVFDIRFQQAEDMDFLLRFLELSPHYVIQDEICLYYRRHTGNITHNMHQLRQDFSRALMFSIRRRRQGNLPPYPADLFDVQSFTEAHTW